MERVIFCAVVAIAFQFAMTASIRLAVYRLGVEVSGHSWRRAASAALMMTVVFGTLFWLSQTLDQAFLERYGGLIGLVGTALACPVPFRVVYRLGWRRAYSTGGLALVGCFIFLTPLMLVTGLLLQDETLPGIVAAGVVALVLLGLVGRSWRQESRFRAEE